MSTTKPKLLLHAGTSKTGTKTLQSALHGSRSRLLTRGLLYPEVDLSPELKHQWIVNSLVRNGLEEFRRNLRSVVDAATHARAERVVLSTEGIFLHWSDFSADAKTALGELGAHFDVTIWTVFREPVSFAMSLYSQVLKNPPSDLTSCYATTLTPEEIADDPWFARRLDYRAFVDGIETLFGAGRVVATRHETADTIEQARRILDVDATILPDVPDRNQGLSMLGVDLMLRLNRLKVDAAERQKMVAAIVDIDRVLGPTGAPLIASKAMAEKIAKLSADSERYLSDRFGIHWATQRSHGGAA